MCPSSRKRAATLRAVSSIGDRFLSFIAAILDGVRAAAHPVLPFLFLPADFQCGLTITNGKVVSVNGGALLVPTGSIVSIANSTISNNLVAAGTGGAIFNQGTLTITGSTFTGNSTAFAGGALENDGTLTVSNSTFSGNDIGPCGCGPTGGAVLFEVGGTAMISNCTIAGNTENLDPISSGLGVIANNPFFTGTVHVRGTIIANNTTNLGGNCTGTITDDGYNLEDTSPSTCGFSSANNSIVGSDPALGPLADNSGPTFTRVLLPNSPAIDKGKNFSGSTTDQRGTGFARTYDDPAIANATGGDGTDIGAFEVQARTPTPTPTPAYACAGSATDQCRRNECLQC
jgi:Right handed beta helix region